MFTGHLCHCFPQSWLVSWIPEWLWVILTRYFNAHSRRACLVEREAAGAPIFSRKVFYATSASAVSVGPGGRRHESLGSRPGGHHDVPFRRTPSPKSGQMGRVRVDSASESPASPRARPRAPSPTKGMMGRAPPADSSSPSLATSRRNIRGLNSTPNMTAAARRISLEEISRSRSSSIGSHSGGAIPPPIREVSLTFSAPSTPSDIGGAVYSPKFDRATSSSGGGTGSGGGRAGTPPPRRSSTVSLLEPPTRRLSACKRTSRVLVMPSLAVYSYSPERTASNASAGGGPQQNENST